MSVMKISNGTVYDPANGVDGVVKDMWIREAKLSPAYDSGVVPDIKKWFESFYTIQFANYPVDASYLSHGGYEVSCR